MTRTRFKKIKGYKNLADAESRKQQMLKTFPDAELSITKKQQQGKYKATYILRQVVKKGSKRG